MVAHAWSLGCTLVAAACVFLVARRTHVHLVGTIRLCANLPGLAYGPCRTTSIWSVK